MQPPVTSRNLYKKPILESHARAHQKIPLRRRVKILRCSRGIGNSEIRVSFIKNIIYRAEYLEPIFAVSDFYIMRYMRFKRSNHICLVAYKTATSHKVSYVVNI